MATLKTSSNTNNMNKAFKTPQTQGVFVELRPDAQEIAITHFDNNTVIGYYSPTLPNERKTLGRHGFICVVGNYKYIGQVGSADLEDTGLTESDMKGLNNNWAVMVEGL